MKRASTGSTLAALLIGLSGAPSAEVYLRHSIPLPSNLKPSCISRVYHPQKFGIGYLFGDSTIAGVVYSDEQFSQVRDIPLGGIPKQIVNQLPSTDTLLAYSVFDGPYLRPWLKVTTIDPFGDSTRSVLTKLQPNHFTYYTCDPLRQRLYFTKNGGAIRPIALSTLMLFCDYIPTAGVYTGTSATTAQFDARLDDSIGVTWPVERRDWGRYGSSNDTLIASLNNYLDNMDDGGDTQPPYGWDVRFGGVNVSLSSGQSILTHEDSYLGPRDIRVGNFIGETPGDELIFQGTSTGLLGEYGTPRSLMACYDFVDGTPQTRWIREVDSALRIEAIWELGDQPFALVCSKQGSSVEIHLALTGELIDSSPVGKTLSPYVVYVDSFNGSWNAEIAGCADGQLYIYNVSAVSDVEDTTASNTFNQMELDVSSYSNGPVVVSYSLTTPTHVKVDVYNLLGQAVITLVDEDQSIGPHRRQWGRTDGKGQHLSSGVYFIRLSTAQGSTARKIQLVK